MATRRPHSFVPPPILWSSLLPSGPIKLFIHGPKSVTFICRNRTQRGQSGGGGGGPKDVAQTRRCGGHLWVWGPLLCVPPHLPVLWPPFPPSEPINPFIHGPKPIPSIYRTNNPPRPSLPLAEQNPDSPHSPLWVAGPPSHRPPPLGSRTPPMAAARRPCCRRYSISPRSHLSFSS